MCKVGRMRNPLRASEMLVASLVLASLALGCGDNSKECGPGTIDEGGVCVPAENCGFGTTLDEETGDCVADGSVVCGEGTELDPLTGRCKVSESACRDGTVLVHNACVDPAAELTIDLQEGPEPNGLGIVEASDAQAGNITLKAAGATYVVHGTIAPWRDADGDGALDPDIDTYVVSVTRPTLLAVTADGVHGLLAGFVAVAAVEPADPLADWQRYGIHVLGDTSRRQLFLPQAGTYRIAIGDVRTLHQYLASGSATAAPGGAEAEYYLSLTDLGPPPVTTLAASTINGAFDGESVLFFQPAAGTGISTATVDIPSDLARASAVAMVNSALRAIADETSQPAHVMFGALASGDTTVVVVDHVFAIPPSPSTYALSVTTTPL